MAARARAVCKGVWSTTRSRWGAARRKPFFGVTVPPWTTEGPGSRVQNIPPAVATASRNSTDAGIQARRFMKSREP